jgi:carboxypeptidase D
MISMTTANGPFLLVSDDGVPRDNLFSWTKLASVLYGRVLPTTVPVCLLTDGSTVDQPVGTGYSPAGKPVTNNKQVTISFINWLHEFYEIFPQFRDKRVHIMGESYAGIYIPYFAEAIMKDKSLHMNLKSISLGDGTFGNNDALSDISITEYLQDQQANLRIPTDVLTAFRYASDVCGFTNRWKNAAYPPAGKIVLPINPHGDTPLLKNGQRCVEIHKDCIINPTTPREVLASIFHSPCYPQCAIFSTALDYLQGWKHCFSMYNIQYNCTTEDPLPWIEAYFNQADVRAGLYISKSEPPYQACNRDILNKLTEEDVEPPAYRILPSLLSQGIKVHIYEGAYDMLVNHKGTELVIQNMTWNGAQGFQKRPDRAFEGGRWGYERGLSYHLFENAGHAVPKDRKEEAFDFVKDFVVGDTGYWR